MRITTKSAKDALEHLGDYSYLGKHPLAKTSYLSTAEASNHLEQGEALSQWLQAAIAQLKRDDLSDGAGREALFHPILDQAYVARTRNHVIARNLHLSERMFYRHLNKAIAALVSLLNDMEQGGV